MIYPCQFRIGFFFLFCLLYGPLSAQNTFQKTFGENKTNFSGNDLLATAGGYVAAITVQDSASNKRPALMKTSAAGSVLWIKKYGNGNTGEELYSVIEANDGGFLAVGFSNGTNTPWNSAILIVKTDIDGNLEWEKIIPDYQTNGSSTGLLVVAVPGGYVVSGRSSKSSGTSVLIRIDNQGELVWSKRYSTSSFDLSQALANFVSGDTLFACGFKDSIATFRLFSASTGTPLANTRFEGLIPGDKAFFNMAPASNGDLLLSGNAPASNGNALWICRISRTGIVKWSKTYEGIGTGSIFPMTGDHFLVATNIFYPGNNVGNSTDPALMKINGDGDVLWAYQYGTAWYEYISSALEMPDGGVMALGSMDAPGNNTYSNIFLLRTDINGLVEGCCRQVLNPVTALFPVVQTPQTLNQTGFDVPIGTDMIQADDTLNGMDFCPAGGNPTLEKTIFFCAGDSVNIGGTTYTQPDTFVQVIPAPTGCDTLLTYTLAYSSPSGTTLIASCPANISVSVPAGTLSTIVNYAAPSVQSDCTCPGTDFQQTQGLPSGSAFALGNHTVCFEAQDHCGQLASCCFQVSISEENAVCDVKVNGCLRFELLRITRDLAGQRTYQIRVQNNCAQALTYAAFQLPAGVLASAQNNSIYTAPSGRQYTVRNPNNYPLHSIRFSALGAGIQGGESDVFQYTLPPQSMPNYINALVKLSGQSYVETHLNTFYCAVETEAAGNRSAEDAATVGDAIRIYPNPTETMLFVELNGWTAATVQIRVFNVQGQVVLRQETELNQVALALDLPPGMYLLEASALGSEAREVRRFVVR